MTRGGGDHEKPKRSPPGRHAGISGCRIMGIMANRGICFCPNCLPVVLPAECPLLAPPRPSRFDRRAGTLKRYGPVRQTDSLHDLAGQADFKERWKTARASDKPAALAVSSSASRRIVAKSDATRDAALPKSATAAPIAAPKSSGVAWTPGSRNTWASILATSAGPRHPALAPRPWRPVGAPGHRQALGLVDDDGHLTPL